MGSLSLEQKIRIALSFCLELVGPRRIQKLRSHFGSLTPVWSASESQLQGLLGPKTGSKFFSFIQSSNLDALVQKVQDSGLHILFKEDPDYPSLLTHIFDPPELLYWKGQAHVWKYLNQTLAVVGTREPTPYGIKSTRKIVDVLARNHVCIVSGLALGIDAVAHQSALDASGLTVAVMGTGADVPYPAENSSIYRQIEKEGLIISEFAPGTTARRWTFPMRNRIVSGLSLGTLVMEAGLKSGTLITVDCANEQGRDVFAVPGSIFSSVSVGTHRLIKEGAQILTHPAEILTYYGWEREILEEKTKEKQPINLTKDEKDVYVLISNVSKHIDEIVKEGAFDSGQTMGILTLLEMKGIIEHLPGKHYRKLN